MDNRIITAPGDLIAANGSNYHVRRFGESGPVVLCECGLTMMSACWGWIATELSQVARVIAYDRAGLGWSDEREGLRDAKQVGGELAGLLESLEVNEPLILLGHSLGAIFNRAFAREKTNEVAAMVWLDPAHPNQMQRRGVRRRMRNMIFYVEAARMLASANVPAVELPLIKHLNALPEQDFKALRRFLRNPRHLRTSAREARAWEASAHSVNDKNLNGLPLLVVSARKSALPGWEELQRELAALSDKSTHVTFPEMSHISMLANRTHAAKVTAEIRMFLRSISPATR